jgi:hypothetical protein
MKLQQSMPDFHGNHKWRKWPWGLAEQRDESWPNYQGVNIVDFHHKDLDDDKVGYRANRIENSRVTVHVRVIFRTASISFSVKVGSRSNRESSILLFYTILIF